MGAGAADELAGAVLVPEDDAAPASATVTVVLLPLAVGGSADAAAARGSSLRLCNARAPAREVAVGPLGEM